MRLRTQQAWLPWLSVGVLALLCTILGILQYRWTGEIANAERSRLQEELQSRLDTASHAFNDNLSSALRALIPSDRQVEQLGWAAAWSDRYDRWAPSHPHLIERASVEGPQTLNLTGSALPDRDAPGAVEISRVGVRPDRLLVEVNLGFVKSILIPEMLNTYLANSGPANSGKLDYDVEVVTNRFPPALIYASFPNASEIWQSADASTPLLDIRPGGPPGGPGRFDRGPHQPPPFGGPGRWRLLVRHKSGSLEALVARTQRRNLAVSAAVLLLILGTVAMLIRYSRQAQRLAHLQMNFVTGVSHELRTPLTVIRTAAYNLRHPGFRRSEDHIERYGKLIEAEAGKLEGLVDQVMRFASSNAGHAVRDRRPVAIAGMIEAELAGVRGTMESRGVVLDERIESELPVVMADENALRQALRNLLDNALKYGVENTKRIGVYARTVHGANGDSAEICVADNGPGIPADEQDRIFDPFFRGKRALQDQVHGAGLGLNLVKTIIEAHAGRVSVKSHAIGGTQFTIRIPAAPSGFQSGAAS